MEFSVRELDDGSKELVGKPSHEKGFFVGQGRLLGYTVVSNEVIINGVPEDVVEEVEIGDDSRLGQFVHAPVEKPGLHMFVGCDPQMLYRDPRISGFQTVGDIMEVAPFARPTQIQNNRMY